MIAILTDYTSGKPIEVDSDDVKELEKSDYKTDRLVYNDEPNIQTKITMKAAGNFLLVRESLNTVISKLRISRG